MKGTMRGTRKRMGMGGHLSHENLTVVYTALTATMS